MSRSSLLGSCIVLTALTACADPDASWRGTVHDSAGVRIVENPATGMVPAERLPRIEEDLRIGGVDGPPEYEFGAITGIAVADNGDIYVLDTQAHRVRVYDAQGRFLREMGREGRGPGEFTSGQSIILGPGDTVLVHDAGQRRVVRFTKEGKAAGVFRAPETSGHFAVYIASFPGGRIVQQTRNPVVDRPTDEPAPDQLLVRRIDGTLEDTLFSIRAGGRMLVSSAGGRARLNFFQPEPVWAISDEGRFYFGMSDEYRIERYSLDGRLEAVIHRPLEPSRVTEDHEMAVRNFVRQQWERIGRSPSAIENRMGQFGFGEYLPLFVDIMPGPRGTLWVRQARTGEEIVAEGYGVQGVMSPRWDVFDAEHRFLGTIRMPDGIVLMATAGDYFYAMALDDLEVGSVVRLRVTGLD